MMAENDLKLLDTSNGNDEEDFAAESAIAPKSLFGHSASLLRQAQLDELTEEPKELNKSKQEDEPMEEQPAEENFNKEESVPMETQTVHEKSVNGNGLLVDESKKDEQDDESEHPVEESVDKEPSERGSESPFEQSELLVDEPMSLADELGGINESMKTDTADLAGQPILTLDKRDGSSVVSNIGDSTEDNDPEESDVAESNAEKPAAIAEDVDLTKEEEDEKKVATLEKASPTKAATTPQTSSARRNTRSQPVAEATDEPETPSRSSKRSSRGNQAETSEAMLLDKVTPKSSPRKTPKKANETFDKTQQDDENEEQDAAKMSVPEETSPLRSSKRPTRGNKDVDTPKSSGKPASKSPRKSAKESDDTFDNTQEEEEDAKEEESAPETVAATPTPKRGRAKNTTAAVIKEVEEETPIRALRKRIASTPANATPKATPKGKAANLSASTSKNKKHDDEELEAEDDELPKSTKKTPNPRRSATAKTVASAKKEKGDDPFDFDEMADNHPEPLKNIQMDVQNFGEAKFSKIGSGKYAATEKAAEKARDSITLSPLTSPEKPRLSLMALKKAEADLATNATPRTAGRRKKDDDEMDFETTTPKSALLKSAASKGKQGRKRRSSPVLTQPKKGKLEVPVLSKEDQVSVDLQDMDSFVMLPGARVFALYDKVFYPAIVLSSLNGFGRIHIYFIEDNLDKEIPESAVIPVSLLSGDRLCVIRTDKEDVKAVVIDQPTKKDWDECVFHLRSIADEDAPNKAPKDYHVSWDKLILDHEDWKDYIKEKDSQATKIKEANIEAADQKLTRSSRHNNSSNSTPTLTPTRNRATQKRAETKTEKNTKETAKETTSRGAAKIFSGYAFLLTSANRTTPENQIPFKKNELKLRIQQRGGQIIESVMDDADVKSLLISDTYYRTQKYLAALSTDMPCISHEWIHKCVNEEKFLDYSDYVLQAGMSLVDEKIHPCKKLKGKLLKGKRVCIHSLQERTAQNLTFSEIWEPILRNLGAEIVAYDDLDGQVDYFITDPSCPASTANEAMANGSAVLSSEWLIQTIIMGQPQAGDAHPRFAYNFSGSQA